MRRGLRILQCNWFAVAILAVVSECVSRSYSTRNLFCRLICDRHALWLGLMNRSLLWLLLTAIELARDMGRSGNGDRVWASCRPQRPNKFAQINCEMTNVFESTPSFRAIVLA